MSYHFWMTSFFWSILGTIGYFALNMTTPQGLASVISFILFQIIMMFLAQRTFGTNAPEGSNEKNKRASQLKTQKRS